ncbi:hypothetical protein ACX93W_26885 [Paenibacillus sp. CAU 1782]
MIMGIKLFDRVGDETDFFEFPPEIVNYIDLYRPTNHSAKIPVYHTPYGSYMAVHTLNELAMAYRRYGFVKHGKSTVINERRIAEKQPVDCGTLIIFVCGQKLYINKKL